jgi:hypothetical protein
MLICILRESEREREKKKEKVKNPISNPGLSFVFASFFYCDDRGALFSSP